MEYPQAQRSTVTDESSGCKPGPVQIPNPYKWLEESTKAKTQAFIQAQNTQFHSYFQDPELDTSRQVLQKTLLQLQSLPSLAGLPWPVENVTTTERPATEQSFPLHIESINRSSPNNKDGDGLIEVSEKSHNEADDGGALVSSGFSRSGKS